MSKSQASSEVCAFLGAIFILLLVAKKDDSSQPSPISSNCIPVFLAAISLVWIAYRTSLEEGLGLLSLRSALGVC